MSQINLYYQTHLNTTVTLLPFQQDSEMDDHLLGNLVQKVKSKVIENGIVIKVHRLIDYDYGIVDKSGLTGDVKYDVKYECLLCLPVAHLEIICVISNMIKGIVVAQNGPVIIVIQEINIDTNKFTVSPSGSITHDETKKKITKGDYIKVSVINTDSNKNDTNITAICKLVDIANRDEIKRYNEDQRLISEIESNANESPVFI
uniref:S1 motif domain-containing protein n=1 Tax=viral metagenome TaxID=1070528 RepID=A0A6C0CBL2_9ZZZZ